MILISSRQPNIALNAVSIFGSQTRVGFGIAVSMVSVLISSPGVTVKTLVDYGCSRIRGIAFLSRGRSIGFAIIRHYLGRVLCRRHLLKFIYIYTHSQISSGSPPTQ